MPNEKTSVQKESKESALKRYYAHDFLIGSPILVDTHEKTITFYNKNLYGQIYNLPEAIPKKISNRKARGLIRRLNNPSYLLSNNLVIDKYIYSYILTDAQRAECRITAWVTDRDPLIAETDDFYTAVKTMCEWVYEYEYSGSADDKEKDRERLMKYCDAYLANLTELGESK